VAQLSPLGSFVEVMCCVGFDGFVYGLLYGGSAVGKSVSKLPWKSVAGRVSVTFCSTLCLPVHFLVSFDVEVTWYPTYGDAEVVKFSFVSGEFYV
jgi:hypothetical protein